MSKIVKCITVIYAALMIMACLKLETIIWLPLVVVPMVLISFILYKLKKAKNNKY